jgi:hypothetical protein
MQDRAFVEEQLTDIKVRYSGKAASFGPLEDLMNLHHSLDGKGRACLIAALRERASDPFWTSTVAAVLGKIEAA